LFEYFQTIKEIYPKAWNNRKYILCKNTGFATMLNLMKSILEDLGRKGQKLTDDSGLVLTKENFKPYFTKIKDFSFSSIEIGTTYLGEAGIRELTEVLRTMMFK